MSTGYNYLSEKSERNQSSFSLNSDLFFDRSDLTITLNNELNQYFGNYDITNLSAGCSLEKRIKDFSSSTSLQFSESQIESYQTIDLKTILLWNKRFPAEEKSKGLSFSWMSSLEPYDYEQLLGTLFLLRRYYFSNSSLYHNLEIGFMQLKYQKEKSTLLPYIDYDISFSRSISDNVGISFDLMINHNLSEEDKVLVPNEDFYNTVSFNSQTVGTAVTYIVKDHLFKPRLSITSRQFLPIAVAEQFGEVEVSSGFYYDVILPGNLLFFADLDYSRIEDDSGWNGIFTTTGGFKYQFDLYVRQE